jgi:hypothetical protein
MIESTRQTTVPKTHLKVYVSQRLALCGIFPRDAFKLVGELPELREEESTNICKVCLAAARKSEPLCCQLSQGPGVQQRRSSRDK